MPKSMKRIILIITSFLMVTIILFPFDHVYAEEQLGGYKEGGDSHYHLDVVPDDATEDKNWWEEKRDKYLWFLDLEDKFADTMSEFFKYIINLVFNMNIFLTRLMISAFDLAYYFYFVSTIIDELSNIMGSITGISSSGKIQSGGLFGNLAIFAALLSVTYATFILIFRRSMFESLTSILQTILSITLAIFLFTNYSSFLTGINQVTTEMSGLVLSGSATSLEEEPVDDPNSPEPFADTPTGLDENDVRDKMRDNIWSLFVDRPYLYMMFGSANPDEIEGLDERMNNILKNEKNSEERADAIFNELDTHNNRYITYSNVGKRVSFTPMYLSINGITSILVYALALALIIFQFWFMIIALFAPFALLIGAVPGMFSVIKRYAIELVLPLVLKIVVAFGALMVFAISEVLYKVDFSVSHQPGNPFYNYIAAAIVHFALFALLFLLRKRIANIFVHSHHVLKELKGGMDTVKEPVNTAVQTTATVGGAVAGGVAGGPMGAAKGAGIGAAVGGAMTGEGSAGDVAKEAGKAYLYSNLGKSMGNIDGEAQSDDATVSDEGVRNLADFMDDKEFSSEEIDNTINQFDKQGIKNVSLNELDEEHEKIMSNIENEGLNDDYASLLAKGVAGNQWDQRLAQQKVFLQQQRQRAQNTKVIKSIPSASNWMDDSVNMYENFDDQVTKANAEPMSFGAIPSASDWMSDSGDMYSQDLSSQPERSSEFTERPKQQEPIYQSSDVSYFDNDRPERENLSELDLSKEVPVNDYAKLSDDANYWKSLEENIPK